MTESERESMVFLLRLGRRSLIVLAPKNKSTAQPEHFPSAIENPAGASNIPSGGWFRKIDDNSKMALIISCSVVVVMLTISLAILLKHEVTFIQVFVLGGLAFVGSLLAFLTFVDEVEPVQKRWMFTIGISGILASSLGVLS